MSLFDVSSFRSKEMSLRLPVTSPSSTSSRRTRSSSSGPHSRAQSFDQGVVYANGGGFGDSSGRPWSWTPRGRRKSAIAGIPLPFPLPTAVLDGQGNVSWWRVARIVLPAAVGLLLLFRWLYEVHIEIALYNRGWIQQSIVAVEPLSGCFAPDQIARTSYNTSLASGPRFTDPHAGISMKYNNDCYNFAGTIQRTIPKGSEQERWLEGRNKIFHLYWRADLRPMEERQLLLIESILATQDPTSRIILWSNYVKDKVDEAGNPKPDPILLPLLKTHSERISLKVVDKAALAVGTPMQGSSVLELADEKAWLDGDIVRVLVLWANGGVWVDMDTIVVRDMTPLLEHEFVTQWDCYDKPYQPLNGAMMHFHQHSPYLCEMLHIMASPPLPRPSSTDWGSLLYHKLFRRLIANGISPFKILPFCFTDGRSCRLDNRLPDPFEADGAMDKEGTRGKELEKIVGNIFAVHLHNQWSKTFPQDGWVRRMIVSRNRELLAQQEGHAGRW